MLPLQSYFYIELTPDGEDPFKEYKGLGKKDWHDYDAMKADEARSGAGEHGTFRS